MDSENAPQNDSFAAYLTRYNKKDNESVTQNSLVVRKVGES